MKLRVLPAKWRECRAWPGRIRRRRQGAWCSARAAGKRVLTLCRGPGRCPPTLSFWGPLASCPPPPAPHHRWPVSPPQHSSPFSCLCTPVHLSAASLLSLPPGGAFHALARAVFPKSSPAATSLCLAPAPAARGKSFTASRASCPGELRRTEELLCCGRAGSGAPPASLASALNSRTLAGGRHLGSGEKTRVSAT